MKKTKPDTITFLGGVGEVTGSRHLLDIDGAKILLDCGLFQGHRRQAIDKNLHFQFDPKQLDAVLLSHAHIDHSGTLPLLVKNGYRGAIHCTAITAETLSVMLMDSARLQMEDAKFFNKIHAQEGQSIQPLYDEDDVRQTLELLVSHDYDEPFAPTATTTGRFWNAGHVLGSAMIELSFDAGKRRLLFSGDMGRRQNLLLNPPKIPRGVDYLILETTYGDRLHAPVETAENELIQAVQQAVAEKGKILIPSFALERTQEIVFLLEKLRRQGKIPSLPFYIDSPMGTKITEIFNRHPEAFSPQAQRHLPQDGDPFGLETLNYVHSVEESQSLNDRPGPMIILSASGMCEGGRILHHLRANIDKPNTIILIVGYQAEGTLGRRFVDGAKKVKIFGLTHTVMAQVRRIRSFSAHADRDDLSWFVQSLSPRPRQIFLVHGDDQNLPQFAETLKRLGVNHITTPTYGQCVGLD